MRFLYTRSTIAYCRFVAPIMCTTAMYYVDYQHESYGVMVMVDSNEECTTIVLEYSCMVLNLVLYP
jgi:hypothetical protein